MTCLCTTNFDIALQVRHTGRVDKKFGSFKILNCFQKLFTLWIRYSVAHTASQWRHTRTAS